MKNCLAIIPARGGSKRIPRKNIKNFCNQPVIKFSIDAAISSKIFDEIMVSTDDTEIADIAKSFGAKIPFLRSAKNSDDKAMTADVIEEVINTYKEKNIFFDYFCCIYPTAPFVTQKKLIDSFNLLVKSNADAVIPIVKFSYPIQRSLKIEDNKLKMICSENYSKRSQDLEPTYHDCGQFYWMNTKSFLEQKTLFAKKTIPFEINELEVQDIDNETDWKVAEIKYKIFLKTKQTKG